MAGTKIISSRALGDALKEAGILPPACRRAIIDVGCDGVVKIYFECFGDERLLEVLQKVAPEIKGAMETV